MALLPSQDSVQVSRTPPTLLKVPLGTDPETPEPPDTDNILGHCAVGMLGGKIGVLFPLCPTSFWGFT